MDCDEVLEWLRIEQKVHAAAKFTDASQAERTRTLFQEDDQWRFFLDQYYHRAHVFGLETTRGRQALAKFVSTAVGMLGSVVQVYGTLPKPGLLSGEIQEWKK